MGFVFPWSCQQWDKHGVVLGVDTRDLQAPWSWRKNGIEIPKILQHPGMGHESSQMMFGCSKRSQKSTKPNPELTGTAQGRQETSKGEECLPGVWIWLELDPKNFSTRDVTAAMPPGPPQPRFPRNSPKEFGVTMILPTAPARNSTPKTASTQILPSPSEQELGLDLEQSAKITGSIRNTQKNPRKIPPFPPHRC